MLDLILVRFTKRTKGRTSAQGKCGGHKGFSGTKAPALPGAQDLWPNSVRDISARPWPLAHGIRQPAWARCGRRRSPWT